MDPMKYLTAFDYGQVTQLANATSQREYVVVAEDKEIEIAEGIKFPAWVYNGFMPGPTLRASVGDRIIIHFENRGSKPHTMHFHGIHPANMDGVFEVVPEGKTFTYDFHRRAIWRVPVSLPYDAVAQAYLARAVWNSDRRPRSADGRLRPR